MDMTTEALLEHYIAYITSPEILLTLAIIVLPLIYLGYTAESPLLPPGTSQLESPIPGCFNLGLSKRSNLSPSLPPNEVQGTKVKALFTYPIQSCPGVEVGASQVEATGLKYDDSFLLASRDAADPTANWYALDPANHPNLKHIKLEIWIPRPPADAKRPARRKDSVGKTIRERSRPRGSTQVDKLERGGGVKKAVAGGDFRENGGCLKVRFPGVSKLDALGVKRRDVVVKVPLEPSAERMQAKGYSREKVVVCENVETALDLSTEMGNEKLKTLRMFLGVKGRLTILHRDVRRRPTSMKMREAQTSCSNLRDLRCHIYATGLEAGIQKGETCTALIGRRLARTSEGLVETDGDYTFYPSLETEDDKTYTLKPFFSRGLIRVGDDIRLLDGAGQDL